MSLGSTVNLVTDTGTSASDAITNTLVFSGTADPGNLVKLRFVDSTGFEVAKLRVIADSLGNFQVQFDPTTLGIPDGLFKIASRAAVPGSGDGIQGNGDSGAADKVRNVTLDTDADTGVPAAVDVDTTGNGVVEFGEANNLSFTVTGLDADATGTVTFTDGIGNVVTVPVSGNGTFTTDIGALDSGSISATLDISDVAGNIASGTGETFNAVICFLAGTMVRTPAGEVAIETLSMGDLVLTDAGEAKPVMWLGRQTVATRFADAARVMPVRIRAGALGEALPVRDLLVSPDHALLVDGVLAQAGALVNGSSIVRETAMGATFTYFHVELADHSLILAEGVAAETFIDNVDRMAFDNWDEHAALYPNGLALVEMELPRAKSARQLPAALRARLADRAAALLGDAAIAA